MRTIYRDIRVLQQAGIPVATEEGKGYFMLEGYFLPPLQFTDEEVNALITAEELVAKHKDRSFIESLANALDKIRAIFRYSQKGDADLLSDRIYFVGNQARRRSSSNLMQIQTAIRRFQLLHIRYCSSDKKRTQRDIEPFCDLQPARQLHLDRILQI